MAEIANGYCKATLNYRITDSTEPCQNVLGFSAGDGAAATIRAVAVYVGDKWSEHIMPELADSCTLENVRVVAWNDQMADEPFGTDGGQVGLAAPPNVTYRVRKVSTLAGSANSGRIYLPGVLEGQVNSGGIVASGVITALTTAFGNLQTDLGTDNADMYILHASPALAPVTVQSFVMESKVATQRRRVR